MGGIQLDNGEASVIRCEFIKDDDTLIYNDKKYTWLELK